jgi:hypothetical protein
MTDRYFGVAESQLAAVRPKYSVSEGIVRSAAEATSYPFWPAVYPKRQANLHLAVQSRPKAVSHEVSQL